MRKLKALSSKLVSEHPLAVGFVALAVIVRIVFWIYTDRTWEDALITLTPARNAWLGYGLTHHLSEPRVHSFTSPISVLVPLLGEAFGLGLTLLKLTALAASAITIVCAYAIGKRLAFPWPAQVLLLGYLATDQLQIFFGMAGMETQIATTLSLAIVYCLLAERWLALGLLTGLGLLTRPEFALWAPVAVAAVAIKSPHKLVASAGAFVAVTVPWAIFAYLYYGSVVPNTIVAKSRSGRFGPFTAPFSTIEAYFIDSWKSIAPFKEWFFVSQAPLPTWLIAAAVAIVLSLALIGIFAALRARDWKLLAVASVLIGFIVYRSATVLSTYFMWYLPPFAALLFLLAAYGLSRISDVQRGLAAALGCGVAALYAWHIPFSFPIEKTVQAGIECDVRYRTGLRLNALMSQNDTVALEPLGYIGFAAYNKTIYDYPGLGSPITVKALSGKDNESLYEIIRALNPSYLVLRPIEVKRFHEKTPEAAARYVLVDSVTARPDLRLERWGYDSSRNLAADGTFLIYRNVALAAGASPQVDPASPVMPRSDVVCANTR